MTNKNNDRRETRVRMGKIFKEARLKKDLTQSELGKMLGKSNNVITNWEKGTNSPDASNIGLLCGILDIPVNYLFDTKESRINPERHSPFGTRKDDQLIKLWRQLPYKKQQKMLSIIEIELEECATSEGGERA